jgi:hypothetical protein
MNRVTPTSPDGYLQLDRYIEDKGVFGFVNKLRNSPDMRNDFLEFNKLNQSPIAMMLFVLISSIYRLSNIIFFRRHSIDSSPLYISYLYGEIVVVSVGVAYVGSILYKYITSKELKCEGLLLTAYVVLLQVVLSTTLLYKIYRGACPEYNMTYETHHLICNQMADCGGLPSTALIYVILYPLVVFALLLQVKWEWLLLCWTMSIVTVVVATTFHSKDYELLFLVGFIIPGSIFQFFR